MSDFDSLREDIGGLAKALDRNHDTAVHHMLEQSRQIDKLWTDNAELRDELHALANRLEALTNFVVSDPAEVAAKIVDDSLHAPKGSGWHHSVEHKSDGIGHA